MLNRFQDYIRRQHLIPSGHEVLLAVSGGRDSVVMAHLMHRAGVPFAVAHCNFHLRPGDCDRDQRFVGQLAAGYGAPFHTVDFDTRAYAAAHGQSIEEAARSLRYRWFASLCATHGYSCLATAHHRDDSIETFFLNLFRGTGIAGLHGIRPVTHSSVSRQTAASSPSLGEQQDGLTIIRPMLCFSRAEIDAYVTEQGLEYVEDSTNAELDARRNRLRLRLMPLLRELYPSVDDTMAANIERLHDTEILYKEYLAELRTRLLKPYPSLLPALPFEIQSLDLQSLSALHSPLSALHSPLSALHSPLSALRSPLSTLHPPLPTLLFELLHPYGFNAAQVSDILSAKGTGRLFHSPTHLAELHRGQLLIAPKAAPVAPPLSALHSPLSTLRLWRPGDRFRPSGMNGQSRLVSDFLKDLHLSRIEKAHVWLRVDADGTILSVIGLRDAAPPPAGPRGR